MEPQTVQDYGTVKLAERRFYMESEKSGVREESESTETEGTLARIDRTLRGVCLLIQTSEAKDYEITLTRDQAAQVAAVASQPLPPDPAPAEPPAPPPWA
jgi:hypothetical protein